MTPRGRHWLHDHRLPDHLAPGLAIVLCGINPGRRSAATGHHYAGPGNRFWPALHRAGLTPRRLEPEEDATLLRYGLGLTNLAPRSTAAAAELGRAELEAGARRLARALADLRPHWLAVLGLGAYRAAFREPHAAVGPQRRTIGDTRVWLLPNPSGRGTHYPLERLAAELDALRRAAGLPRRSAHP
ncbi:MAG TPA: G/U mismatch-specific DNA glycosylase [Thermoanaerobaculia bacterium]|nr:G/U mismatch-specific DNA glycosylase [Thermoanaerobaculia bacterium]